MRGTQSRPPHHRREVKMKRILLAGLICLFFASVVSAQEVATAVKQDNSEKLKVSVLPYPGCSYLYYENMGTLTHHALITVPTEHIIHVYGIEVHSLDTVNKGTIFFENADNSRFYPGYLSTAPSAFGTTINYSVIGTSLKVSTSGATGIVIHYIITTN